MRFFTGYIRFVENMSNQIGKIVGFLIYPVMLVLVYEVVMRYLFNSPTIWAHETSCMLFGTHFILGGVYALRHNAFVSVEVLYMRFSKRIKAIIDLCSWTMFYIFAGVLLIKGLPWAWSSFSVMEYSDSTWGPYIWPVKFTIPIAAFLILLQGSTKTIKDAYLAVTGREIFTVTDTDATIES